MKFPAQAFAEAYPKDLEPGRLFRFREHWALRVSHAEDLEGLLILEGDHAGKVFSIGDGMAKSLAIVQPFNWFPAVQDVMPARNDAFNITLAVTPAGLVLSGSDVRDSFGDDHLSFGLDGRGVDGSDLHRAGRFERWSAELFHEARPFVSLGTLFEVDRRGQQR